MAEASAAFPKAQEARMPVIIFAGSRDERRTYGPVVSPGQLIDDIQFHGVCVITFSSGRQIKTSFSGRPA